MVLPNSLSSYYEKFLANGEVKCIDEEIPFEIPKGWEWCRLGNIGITETGTTPPKTHPEYFGNYIPFLSPANIFEDKIISETQGLSEEGVRYGRVISSNSIIQVCIGGSIGKCAIVKKHVTFNQQINSITPIKCCLEYVHFVLQSETFRLAIMAKATGTATPIINRGNWEQILFPLPPSHEQKRIVAKLEELLPLIKKYSEVQDCLEELNISINDKLKKSILQEAIQGKLVPQIADEGTAQELLEQIRQEKQRLVKEGKLKKSSLTDSVIFKGDDNKYFEKVGKTEQDITDEIPFEIPDDWKWCRIGSVLNIWSARRVHERDWRSSGIPFYRAREIGKMADWGHVDNDLFIEQSLYDEFSKSGVPQIGDLMMTAVGTLGKTYVVETNNPFYYKDGSVLCIGNPFRLNPYYLKLFFESSAFANQYLSESDGTTVATLTMVRLNRYLIPVPPLKEQTRIVEKIKTVTSIMRE